VDKFREFVNIFLTVTFLWICVEKSGFCQTDSWTLGVSGQGSWKSWKNKV
jgi:hypothetical protein